MSETLTRVELFYLEAQVNYWLRFGNFSADKNIDRRRAFVWFKPQQTFCYIRWWANEYGTQGWTMGILRSCLPSAINLQTYPGISPGAKILLDIKGSTYVKRTLSIFDDIEEYGINLCEVSPNYYRYLGLCINNRKSPHPYTTAQHKAWQKTGSAMGGIAR